MFFWSWMVAGFILGFYGIEILFRSIGGKIQFWLNFVFGLIGVLIAYSFLR